MKSVHLFENDAEFEAEYYGDDYAEPWLSFTIEDGTDDKHVIGHVDYNKDTD